MTGRNFDEQPDIEPLELTIWFRELEKLQLVLKEACDDQMAERATRKAYYLSRLAPSPYRFIFTSPCSEAAFETSMKAGDANAGIEWLLNPKLDVTLSQPDGKIEAIVRVIELDLAGHGVARDRASAVLTAWIACIRVVQASWEEQARLSLSDPGRRKLRSGTDRSSSVH